MTLQEQKCSSGMNPKKGVSPWPGFTAAPGAKASGKIYSYNVIPTHRKL